MQGLDLLRGKLYETLEFGNQEEILKISKRLDIEILKYMNTRLFKNTDRPS